MDQVHHDAGTAGAQGMADGDCPAMDIGSPLQFVRARRITVRQFQQANQYRGGIGFVNFQQIQIIQGQLIAFEQTLDSDGRQPRRGCEGARHRVTGRGESGQLRG